MKGPDSGNRSEAVRRRRKRDSGRRSNDSAVLAARPMAPITTRRPVLAPVSGRERPPVRRRRQAAFSVPGIEVRLPAISFSGSAAKWRFISGGLALLLGATLYLAFTAEIFVAGAPRISGNQHLSAEELNAALGIGHTQIFWLDPAELEQRLRLNLPELLEARVNIGLPNTISVQVRERTPVIVWNQEGGYTWIDSDGVAFRPRGVAEGVITVQAQSAPETDATPPSDPLAPHPYISPDLVQAILALAPHVPAGEAILYDAGHGLGWADGRGWQAFFGQESRDMALRLRIYDSLIQTFNTQGIQPAFVSVQYPSAPYYRMNQ